MIQLSTWYLSIHRFFPANRWNMLSSRHHHFLLIEIFCLQCCTTQSSIVSLCFYCHFYYLLYYELSLCIKHYCGMQFFETNVQLTTDRRCFFVYLIGCISVDAREIWWRDIGHRRTARNSGDKIVLDNFWICKIFSKYTYYLKL